MTPESSRAQIIAPSKFRLMRPDRSRHFQPFSVVLVAPTQLVPLFAMTSVGAVALTFTGNPTGCSSFTRKSERRGRLPLLPIPVYGALGACGKARTALRVADLGRSL